MKAKKIIFNVSFWLGGAIIIFIHLWLIYAGTLPDSQVFSHSILTIIGAILSAVGFLGVQYGK